MRFGVFVFMKRAPLLKRAGGGIKHCFPKATPASIGSEHLRRQ